MDIFFFKVHFLDINWKEGEKVQKEFDERYDKGMAKFVKCDVTNEKEFEG